MLTLSKIDAVKTKRPQERLQRYKTARNDPGCSTTINLLFRCSLLFVTRAFNGSIPGKKPFQTLILLEKTPDVEPKGIHHQTQQQHHTHHLRILHKLIAWLTTRDHFINGE